jgi:hypothetical protein
VRLLLVPLERDEGEYAYAGQLLLQGVPPYATVYNMKLPGTYAAYALAEAAFGQTVAGVHLGFLLVNAAAIVLVALVARRLLGAAAGAMAGASYALLSLGPSVLGTSAHATHFAVLPAMGGLLLLLHGRRPERPGPAFLGAVLLGLALVMKQQAAFYPAFGLLLYAAWQWRERASGAVGAALRLATFSATLALPLAVTCLLLWWAGVWERFWFWTVRYAREYAGVTPLALGWANLSRELPRVVVPALPIWGLAGIGLVALLADRQWADRRPVLLGFTFFSALTVVPGLYFRPHYFVTLLPAVAILAGAGVAAVARRLHGTRAGGARVALPAALAFGAVAWPVVWDRAFLFELSPVQASRAMYGLEPFPEAAEIGRRLGADSALEDRIAVIGAEPEIFFHARRRSATGYIYVYPVWEGHALADRMARELALEVEAARPRWVVVEFVPERLRTWLGRFLARSYELEGRVDLVSAERTEYRWGVEARAPGDASARRLYVFRRRPAPRRPEAPPDPPLHASPPP